MRQILICFSLLMAVNAMAQKPEWGRLMEAEKKDYTPTIVGEDEDAIYTVDYHYNFIGGLDGIIFEKYDKRRMNQKYSRVVPLPSGDKHYYDIERISFVEDKFLVFGSLYDRKAKEYELRLFTYSAKNAGKEDDYEIYRSEVEKRRRKGDFSVTPSKNNQRFLVHYSAYFKEKDQTLEVLRLYDKDVNLLTDKEYVSDGDNGYSLDNIVVDDEGSVYFFRGGNSVAILDANADYEEWSEPIVADELENNGVLIDKRLTLNTDNDVVIVAHYMTVDLERTTENKRRRDRKKDDTQIEGVYFMRVNGFSKETEVAQLNMFSEEFIDQFKSERDLKKGRDAEMNNDYGSMRFFFKDDGGVVFVAEKQYIVSTYTQHQAMYTKTGEKHYFEDLVTYNFNADGELIWSHRIPKKQMFYWSDLALGFTATSVGLKWFNNATYAKDHFSYVAGLSEDKFYLIYNDDKKNANVQDEHTRQKYLSKVKKAVPVVYEIDLETGHKEKRMALNFTSTSAHFKPGINYQRSQTEPLYIFSMKKKSFRFGKLDFADMGKKGRGKRVRR